MESMSIRGQEWAGPWSLSILCLSQANEAGCRAGIGKRWSWNRIHIGPAPSSCLLAFDCLKAADMVAALFSTSHRTHKAETCCSRVRRILVLFVNSKQLQMDWEPGFLATRIILEFQPTSFPVQSTGKGQVLPLSVILPIFPLASAKSLNLIWKVTWSWESLAIDDLWFPWVRLTHTCHTSMRAQCLAW